MRMKSVGEWIGPGRRVVKNQLRQAAFDMIGDFFVGPGGPRPMAIALGDEDDEIFVTRPCSFVSAKHPTAPIGVVITGTATFSAMDLSAPAHGVALIDSAGNVLAEAELDPPLPAGQAVVITRRDTFIEAD